MTDGVVAIKEKFRLFGLPQGKSCSLSDRITIAVGVSCISWSLLSILLLLSLLSSLLLLSLLLLLLSVSAVSLNSLEFPQFVISNCVSSLLSKFIEVSDSILVPYSI